jgi:hypothetical protein
MACSISVVHGKSWTKEPRPACQSGAFSGNAETSRRRLAMTHRHGRNINAHPDARIFRETPDNTISAEVIRHMELTKPGLMCFLSCIYSGWGVESHSSTSHFRSNAAKGTLYENET